MDAREVLIERLLPHRGAMRWIDRLLDCDADSVRVEAVVRDDHVLARADGVPAFAGIEFMAQAIACWAGTRALARGEAVRPGFLLGTRRYVCHRPSLAYGLCLTIEARCELFGENGLGMFACRILDGDEEIACANVSVFEPPHPIATIRDSDT
jgi:predicted hotdog family 3-hydroxylacyl-ACP dehydratase